jgi:hypothetical protein
MIEPRSYALNASTASRKIHRTMKGIAPIAAILHAKEGIE